MVPDTTPADFDDWPDVRFDPFASSATAVALAGVLSVVVLVYSAWSTGQLVPPWPPLTAFHFLAWILPPVAVVAGVFSYGWSYTLESADFVVCRFGRERDRLMLGGFRSSASFLGWLRLDFQHRSVWMIANLDSTRQAFLAELRERASVLGNRDHTSISQIDGQHIRLPVERLRFPSVCVRCGNPMTDAVPLTAQRGVDLGLYRHVESVDVQVPVCAMHQAAWRRARVLGWVAFVPFSVAIGAFVMLIPGSVWSGALLLGLLGGAAVYPPLYRHFGRGICDWRVLGLRTTNLSSDLFEITLRFIEPALLATVKKTAEGDA